ncbi:MAG: methyltransferase domain-containing protein [Planctomycetota bacterium]|jgi:ubiquinone/menaquinone biosynthesis C-methylase UbiE
MLQSKKKHKRLATKDEWDVYFAEGGGWEVNKGREQTRLFAEAFCMHTRIRMKPGYAMLDSSCALGDALPVFNKRFPGIRLYGCDFSTEAIRRAESRFSGEASFSVASVDEITETYDVIYSSATLEHFQDYKEKARSLLQHCRYLCILVPYNEQRHGKDLEYDPDAHHVVTFREDSFNFLLDEGLAEAIYSPKIFRVPKAWSWSLRNRIVQPLKNIVRPLLNRPIRRDNKMILFEIKRTDQDSARSAEPVSESEVGVIGSTPEAKNVFNRSGLATLSDLSSPDHQAIYSKLEIEQAAFLDKESEFRSNEYTWPRDPLHDFSRVWEYPYVYHHLAAYLKTLPQDPKPVVADVGSGVTFFPFSLAKIGYQVVCTDIDRICKRDLALARECVPHSPGTVDFRLIEGSNIPFEDSECDALYCISVLEHIPDFEKTIAEMARILKPGGLCLITCDINLQPEDGLQLDSAQYARLMSLIDSYFLRVCPERTIHPADILTTRNSPYPLKGSTPGSARIVCRLIKQKILKPLLGRRPGRVRIATPHVAVLGLVLRKGM